MAPERKPSAPTTKAVAVESWGRRFARCIEDPFESMVAGLVAPAAAVCFAFAAMFGLAVIH